MRNISSIFLIILLSVAVFGCCNQSCPDTGGKDAKILARINDYDLTAADLEDEAKADPRKDRKELLDELITKKILVQEAQRRNFDKDKAFMKEIERYWEQALIKSLLKAKIKEISQDIKIENKDARDKKIQEGLDNWLTSLRDKANVKIYKGDQL